MVDASLWLDVLHDLAFYLPDHLQLRLDFCSVDRIGTVDCAAADHNIGRPLDWGFGQLHYMSLARNGLGQSGNHSARPRAANSPNFYILAAAGNHFRTAGLHCLTTRFAEVVLDIDHEMNVVVRADCTCCMP